MWDILCETVIMNLDKGYINVFGMIWLWSKNCVYVFMCIYSWPLNNTEVGVLTPHTVENLFNFWPPTTQLLIAYCWFYGSIWENKLISTYILCIHDTFFLIFSIFPGYVVYLFFQMVTNPPKFPSIFIGKNMHIRGSA